MNLNDIADAAVVAHMLTPLRKCGDEPTRSPSSSLKEPSTSARSDLHAGTVPASMPKTVVTLRQPEILGAGHSADHALLISRAMVVKVV